MLNKKYTVIWVTIIVAIIGFVIFSYNFFTPDPLKLEQGVKKLTRESAAKKIEEYLSVKTPHGFTVATIYDEVAKGYVGAETLLNNDELQQLEKDGFVKIVKTNFWGNFIYNFTDKAAPYLVSKESDTGRIGVILGKLIKIEVTGITEPAQGIIGGNYRMAKYTAKYELTLIGKIIFEKAPSLEQTGEMLFILYDDGWRIKDD